MTDYPPDTGGGGAVILRSLLQGEDRRRIYWAHLTPGKAASSPEAPGVLLERRRAPLGADRFLSGRSMLLEAASAGRIADDILRLASERGARALWVVLHGTMVHVAARLVGRPGGLPVHVTVHDDPPFGVALMSRRYLALVPAIARDFARALRGAASVDVISAGMAERYRTRYGVHAEVVHRGMDGPVAPTPSSHAQDDGLEVAVLGNTYGFGQLPQLAEAMQRAAQALGSRRARLVVFGQADGRRLEAECGPKVDVEIAGHLAEPAAVSRLQRSFLLYLNYPFSRRAAVLGSTSFPTKLSTYVLAARPLLVHAPAGSSLAPLRSFANYAFTWEDERPAQGAATILRAWRTDSAHASQHGAAEEVRRRFYDRDTNRAVLGRALNALV